MVWIGVICEYNPFHLGHKKQLDAIRARFGADCGIVCLMSGNFVQRGAPAVFPKEHRAAAALAAGADLVLELPVEYALSSAEGFARGGVAILSPLCRYLCFGAEHPDAEALLSTARRLLSEDFSRLLKEHLAAGRSFPAARQAALEALGGSSFVQQPNDILAVEYCKAILEAGSAMAPFPIHRPGSYHASIPDAENPSATALRAALSAQEDWLSFIPPEARTALRSAPIHTLAAGERAVLSRLRTMTEADFQQLPHGTEGLWRKFMHACRKEASIEDICTAVKSKRYTRSRIDRMLMCAFLGLTGEDLQAPPPYVRVLGFTEKGRSLLSQHKKSRFYQNIGQPLPHPRWEREQVISDLYDLFSQDSLPAPGRERQLRVIYKEALSTEQH